MMEQSLLNNLAVFPIPGREHGLAEEAHAAEEALKAAAYQAGFAAGRQEAEEAFATRESNIDNSCTRMMEQIETITAEIEGSHRQVIIEILGKALPAMVRSQAATEVVNIIENTAKGRLSGVTQIHTGREFAEELLPRLKNVDTNQKLKLLPDESKDGFEVTLSWDGGNADINLQATVDECLAVLQAIDGQ